MKSLVSDLLAQKGDAVYSIGPDATVFDAIGTMVEKNAGSLLVTEEAEILGILTERDYLRRVALEGRSSRSTRVREIMTTELVVVSPDCDLEQAMAVMTEKRIRHLPVMAGSGLAGVISIGDIVRHLSAERKAEIAYLNEYISGRYPA